MTIIMQRKVVKNGPSTLTISLPSIWCKKHNVEEGNILNINLQENSILIGLENKHQIKKINLNLCGYGSMAERIVSAFYKEGYDEFELTYETSNELKSILNVINKTFIGLEITEQKSKKISIKTLAKIDSSEFNDIYRKIFFQLKNIVSDTLDAIQTRDYNKIEELIMLDRNINRFSDYCKRLISRNLVPLKNNGMFHFIIIEQLETLGDEYRNINKYVLKTKLVSSNNLLNIFKKVNGFFYDFNNMYFSFELKKMKKFWDSRNAILNELKKLNETVSREEISIIFHLTSVVNLIFDLYDIIIMINS